MKRKTSSVPTRIWTFGARAPVLGADRVREQVSLAHRYYNVLIEVERTRRDEFRAARTAASVTMIELEAKHAAIDERINIVIDSIKQRRAAERKRTPAGKDEQYELKLLKEERKAAYEEIKAERVRLKEDPDLKAAAERINEAANEKVRKARGESGIYWGTYLIVEKAVEAARKSKLDPRFKRWTGQGRIGVQVHGVVTTSDLFTGASQVLQLTPRESIDRRTPGSRRSGAKRMTLRIRVGSNEDRSPMWAEFPVLLHRQMPAGAVKWAWVRLIKVGTRMHYELQLVIESSSFASREAGNGVVALDIGWRAMEDGSVRVAYGVDQDGDLRLPRVGHGGQVVVGDLRLPREIPEGLRKAESLRSASDLHFDVARAEMKRWLDGSAGIPEWLTEATAAISHWRAHGKLAAVAYRFTAELGPKREVMNALWQKWRDERLAAGADLLATPTEVKAWAAAQGIESGTMQTAVYLEWWRTKNRHLFNWECSLRRNVLARRKDIFRNWAAQIEQKYGAVVIEKFDLRTFTRSAKPEEDETQDYLHWQMRAAAPNELRLALISACGKERVHAVDCVNSTRECAICGHTNTWEKAVARVVTCGGPCKSSYDQDLNASKILLTRFGHDPEPKDGQAVALQIIETDEAVRDDVGRGEGDGDVFEGAENAAE